MFKGAAFSWASERGPSLENYPIGLLKGLTIRVEFEPPEASYPEPLNPKP